MIAELLIQYGLPAVVPTIGSIVTAVMAGRAKKAACETKEVAEKGKKATESVHHQVIANGGDSLRDAVNEIKDKVDELMPIKEAVDELVPVVKGNTARLVVLEQRPRIALFTWRR